MITPKVFFIDLIYAPIIGGTATMFKQRASMFPDDTIIVLSKSCKHSEEFDTKQHYKIIRKKFGLKGFKGFEWFFTAIQIFFCSIQHILSYKINLIEAARPFPEGFSALFIHFFLRKKYILNIHGEDIAIMSKYKIEKIALWLMFKYASIILCNSTFTKKLASELYPFATKKLNIVFPGFTPYKMDDLDKIKLNSTRASFDGSPVLITIARVAQRKGHDKVIEALPEITRFYPDIRYVIAGSFSPEEGVYAISRLKELSYRLGVLKNLIFVTNFNEKDKPYLLCSADLFVMPNRQLESGDVEGYGIVFLEASSMGIPVIGGNSGGVVDAIIHGETGLLVDSTSVQEVKNAILFMLNQPNLARRMGKCGTEFSRNYDYISTFKTYYELLEKCIL